MGEIFGKVVEALADVFRRNYKRPKLWILVGVIFFFLILLLPYIDSNFFYFSRMEKRINILGKVMAFDQEMINSNQVYINEYQSILQEMEQQRDYFFGMGKGEGNKTVKFLTGALWFIVVTICIPFMNRFKTKRDKVLAFVLFAAISVMVGTIFSIIPVIISPMVNYAGFPLLQLGIITMIVDKSDKKERIDKETVCDQS